MAKKTTKKTGKKAADKPMKKHARFVNIDMRQVRILAERGFTDLEMSAFFEVSESGWHKWKIEHPEFKTMLDNSKETANARVERALFERATGYEHGDEQIFCQDGEVIRAKTKKHYPPDATSAIFWLKNRMPDKWKDKQDIEVSGKITLGDVIAKARKRAKKDSE